MSFIYIYIPGDFESQAFLHPQNLNFTNEATERHDIYFVCIFFCKYIHVYIFIYIYIYTRILDPFQDGKPAAKASEVWSFMHCVPS